MGFPSDSNHVTLTSLGNEGFLVSDGPFKFLFDPFVETAPGIHPGNVKGDAEIEVICITHDHWDHLNVEAVALTAHREGAHVIGTPSAIRKIKGLVPEGLCVALSHGQSWTGETQTGRRATVRAFETQHGRQHNSFLVESSGFRFFHDGDNEHTECLDRSLLMHLDILMICPWQGSGWVEFIEALSPRWWVLMHVTQDELDQHERGEFFPDLCDHIPGRLKVLRPGESFTLNRIE